MYNWQSLHSIIQELFESLEQSNKQICKPAKMYKQLYKSINPTNQLCDSPKPAKFVSKSLEPTEWMCNSPETTEQFCEWCHSKSLDVKCPHCRKTMYLGESASLKTGNIITISTNQPIYSLQRKLPVNWLQEKYPLTLQNEPFKRHQKPVKPL